MPPGPDRVKKSWRLTFETYSPKREILDKNKRKSQPLLSLINGIKHINILIRTMINQYTKLI